MKTLQYPVSSTTKESIVISSSGTSCFLAKSNLIASMNLRGQKNADNQKVVGISSDSHQL